MVFVIYGAGSPIEIESYHPEIAEAIAVAEYGLSVENLVTREKKDVVLSGGCDT